MSVLESYHRLERLQLPQGAIYIKPGVRGYPDPPPAERVFRLAFEPDDGAFVDATGTAGAVALAALAAAGNGAERAVARGEDEGTGVPGHGSAPTSVVVLEPSKAALHCARKALGDQVSVSAGLPWDLLERSTKRLALAPPADRGNARVGAELAAAAKALETDGVLYVALHKDQGAKRFQKGLSEWFRSVEAVERQKGWRLIEARDPIAAPADDPPWLGFEAAGLPLETLPGVHAAGRLDPGTALLIETVPWDDLAEQRVLDLGCGVGILALLASGEGAEVVAVDDDLAAVESARRNSKRLGLPLDVRHSDVDSALPEERFDLVLCNPPFHVGRGVRLDVPRAFVAAAGRLLRPGGELWLVANRDLPYEREVEAWSNTYQVASERGFKVLRAVR